MKTDYLVYGAGAVGGVIGARLHLSGQAVTLVARGEHLARIRSDGLLLDAADGHHVVDAPATDTARDVDWGHQPVVLLTVKSHQTTAALDDLAAHGPRDLVVVCAQNGVANEPAALRRFARTYAITVMLPSGHLEPGVVEQGSASSPGILDVGRFPDGTDETTGRIARDLRAAGFESVSRPDIMAWKHRKLVLNLGNGVDAAFTPGPDADELRRRAQDEGEQVLAAAGVPAVTAARDRERRGDLLRARPDRGRGGSSTWQSLERGGDTEIDYLSGEIVLLARLHGLAAPVNEAVQDAVHGLARAGGSARSLDPGALLADLAVRPAAPTGGATILR